MAETVYHNTSSCKLTISSNWFVLGEHMRKRKPLRFASRLLGSGDLSELPAAAGNVISQELLLSYHVHSQSSTIFSSMSSENRSNPGDHIDLVRSDVWYDDGNVVLQAQNAQFKIHKSILVHSSAVFRDMLSLPQPPLEDTYVVDGCPVVHLSDSAEEVRYILQAIFQRKCVIGLFFILE